MTSINPNFNYALKKQVYYHLEGIIAGPHLRLSLFAPNQLKNSKPCFRYQ